MAMFNSYVSHCQRVCDLRVITHAFLEKSPSNFDDISRVEWRFLSPSQARHLKQCPGRGLDILGMNLAISYSPDLLMENEGSSIDLNP